MFNIITAFISLASLALVVAEIYLHFARKRRYYRYVDVVTNLQTLFLYQVLGAAALGVIYTCYNWIYTNFAFLEQSVNSPLAWVGGFILTDFCHYWFHRTSHQNNFLWGIHQGHHTSEDFNLSTAVRKGIFQQWVDWPFFLPMAFLGFPFFTMYLPLKGLQFAYQFWLHNQFVGKIPLVEKVLVTPSLHRVHHGQNPQYIDKNHAGVFIIWDKLFGTYAEENDPVVYGTTVAVKSFNPIGVQFVWWRDLWRDAVNTKRWRDKLAIPFRRTGWRPADVVDQPRQNQVEDLDSFEPYDLPVDGKTKLYVASQVFAMFLIIGMVPGQDFSPATNAVHGFALAYLILGCTAMGFLVNNSPRAARFEWVRHLSTLALCGVAVTAGYAEAVFRIGLVVAALSTVFFAIVQFLRPRSAPSAGSPTFAPESLGS